MRCAAASPHVGRRHSSSSIWAHAPGRSSPDFQRSLSTTNGGVPDGVLLVNGYDREPITPSSVLAHVICRDLPGNENSAWLAALGAIADLGTAAPFASLINLRPRGTAWSKAISLLNAGRRAPEDDAETALRVLQRAADVRDIVHARDPDAARLAGFRRAVQAEVDRVSRVPPQIHGDVAILRFSSAAQVHPIIATRWARRMAPAIVIAANEGFLPGRVNFAARPGVASSSQSRSDRPTRRTSRGRRS